MQGNFKHFIKEMWKTKQSGVWECDSEGVSESRKVFVLYLQQNYYFVKSNSTKIPPLRVRNDKIIT